MQPRAVQLCADHFIVQANSGLLHVRWRKYTYDTKVSDRTPTLFFPIQTCQDPKRVGKLLI